ncbi:hypothetical protein P3T39_004896 [Kitasatospora sp. GP82]|nr:hypothetical protein [Kitasatospora sp. GP82]
MTGRVEGYGLRVGSEPVRRFGSSCSQEALR